MFLMLINDYSYVSGVTMEYVMDDAIRQGYFESEAEFADSLPSYPVYKIGEPLKITAKISQVIFTVEE